jgi:serine-type D-Ala-D-Ala carboxypeptidase/endopeptidase (penicillin-binding protein 4)
MYGTMKKCFLISSFLLFVSAGYGQEITEKLQRAFNRFEKDSQLRTAISSLYVVEERTGSVVFEKNAHTGLAPASTQKIITSATAYELLGNNFRYATYIGYDIGIRNREILGNLFVMGSGDPTLGSFRWNSTRDTSVFQAIIQTLHKKQVNRIKRDIWIIDMEFDINPVPDGWIWQDIGNYYGAGSWSLNWQENQYDLILDPAEQVDGLTKVVKTIPLLYQFKLANFIRTGNKGTGDNGYIYYSPYSNKGMATGTIPLGEKSFKISGAVPQPARQFGFSLQQYLRKEKFQLGGQVKIVSDSLSERKPVPTAMFLMDSILSPDLDSITYWFLKKSVNLYGEALLKTMAMKKYLSGTTARGVTLVRDFWSAKGIDPAELNIVDGSGLSPLNRVTTHAQVSILQYAKKQPWFNGYYAAFPEYNDMKMKSGTINGAKGFCGYQVAANGRSYIFSFLVNNYNGSAARLVQKMYQVLNELK